MDGRSASVLAVGAFMVSLLALGSPAFAAPPPPALSVSAPADNTVTNDSTVAVSGSTDPFGSLVINGYFVDLDAGGNFTVVLALLPGLNVINATASTGPSTSTTVLLNVTRIDGGDLLAKQLRATRDELNNTQSQLSDTQDDLASVRIDLIRTRNDLTNSTDTVAALSGQVLALSILATVGMLAALGAIGLTMVQAARAKNGNEGPPGDKPK